MTEQGRTRLASFTKQNLHKRIAVMIGGNVVSVPVIQAELNLDSLPVRGDFDRQQAEHMASEINAAVKSR